MRIVFSVMLSMVIFLTFGTLMLEGSMMAARNYFLGMF